VALLANIGSHGCCCFGGVLEDEILAQAYMSASSSTPSSEVGESFWRLAKVDACTGLGFLGASMVGVGVGDAFFCF
jgi:hypothetical protein